jgi:excisionase family DNA binding protein
MTKLMNIQEAAQYLRVSKKTIYRLIEQGKIPAAKVGKQWRLSRPSMDEWLQRKSLNQKASILVVDDEEIIRSLFKETLEESEYKVITIGNSAEGLELVKHRDFDLVFLDLKMPDLDGAELLRQIRKLKPKLRVTIITGYPESDMMARALAQGPFGVMCKPFNDADIIGAVSNFLRISPEEKNR